jgi:hypothetical protein
MHALPKYFFVAVFFLLSSVTSGQEQNTSAFASQLPQQQIASTNLDAAWRPSSAQHDSIDSTTKAYFAAQDANKAEAAYAFLSERQKKYVPFGLFSRMLDDFNTKAGELQSRTLRKVTWYKDTPQAGPGLYVAVDFSSNFSGLALQCGYVVWNEQPDGSFLQVREEVNLIDNATMAKLKPGQLEQIRTQFHC